MRKIMTLMAITLLCTSIAAYSADKPKAAEDVAHANTATAQIQYSDPTKPILVKAPFRSFSVTLEDNPTTGFKWFLTHCDHQLVHPVKRVYKAANPQLAGAPGYSVWVFDLTPAAFDVPQALTVQFVRLRPWEMKEGAVASFHILTTDRADKK